MKLQAKCVECDKIFEYEKPQKFKFGWCEPNLCSDKCIHKSMMKFTNHLTGKLEKALR